MQWNHQPIHQAVYKIGVCFTLLSLTGFWIKPVQAQPIVPANDGTGTIVTPNGNQLDIHGGQRSQDGANLFHSFQQFGLDANQIANFLAQPNIQNILGRVVGGDASIIKGLIQVTGGNANLYLMNPAGIVFGSTARLNVPASFTATTATGIGFGNHWFSAIETNNHAILTGAPDTFAFAHAQPGAIINAGNLSVTSGQQLTLLGGTVISTGELNAPDGQITIAAIPGQNRVRISHTNSLLSLELTPLAPSPALSVSPLSLPQLLTGGNVNNASELTINANGQVELVGAGLSVEAGDVAVRQLAAETGLLSAPQNVTLFESQLHTTSNLNLAAQQTIRVRDSIANPVLIQAGGNLTIQGNQGIDILALNHPTPAFQSGGNLTLISDGVISGDAHYRSGGNFSLLNLVGGPGNFISLYDPIISSLGDVNFGNYTGVSLKVEAIGSITGGNIEITGPDVGLTGTDPDIAILTGGPALILRAGLPTLANPPNVPQTTGGTTFVPGAVSTGGITVGNIDTTGQINGDAGPIILSATGIIITGNLDASSGSGNSGNIQLLGSDITTGFVNTVSNGDVVGNSGAVTMTATSGNITTNSIITFKGGIPAGGTTRQPGVGGAVTLTAPGNITVNGTLSPANQANNGAINTGGGGQGNAGRIQLTSTNGIVRTTGANPSLQRILAVSDDGDGGSVTINARNGVEVGEVRTNSTNNGAGGNLTIATTTGNISSGALNSEGTTQGGVIDLKADNGSVNPGNITLGSPSNTGGDLSVNAAQTIDLSDGIDAKGASLVLGDQTTPNTILLPANINTAGGDFVLNLNNNFDFSSTVNTAGGSFALTSPAALTVSGTVQTNGGGINLRGATLTIGDLNTSSNVNGGAIDLTATNGNLSAGTLTTSGSSGSGGAIDLTARGGAVNSGNLISSGAEAGGAVTVIARDSITTQTIDTSSSAGSGGAVSLDPIGNVQVSSINAQGGNNGGNVDITAGRFFQASGSFTDRNGITASISTAGGNRGGSITIRHSGGSLRVPFIVGGASNNGTAAAITSGISNSILPPQSFPGPFTQNNIQLLTQALQGPPQNAPPEELPSDDGSLPDDIIPNPGSLIPESTYTRQFEELINRPGIRIKTLEEIRRELAQIEKIGVKPALIYTVFVPEFLPPMANNSDRASEPQPAARLAQQDTDYLALILVTAKGKVIGRRVPNARRAQVIKTVNAFSAAIKDPDRESEYLTKAQQLYQWLVLPLKKDLEAAEITNLVYIMDSGLRSLPLAAMHDGKQFVIAEYSVGLMPSMSLTDAQHVDVKQVQTLAMGASQFPSVAGLSSEKNLPTVPLELTSVTDQIWQGSAFLNEDFTLDELNTQRDEKRFGIVHLATHAEFYPSSPDRSYIRLWDEKLDFNKLRELNLNKPPIELLVLSACRTAIGNSILELGFAGLSVQIGVKSSLASLWYVDDEATFVLMSKFYRQLSQSIIKADALRLAQLEMQKEQLPELQELLTELQQDDIEIPSIFKDLKKVDYSHPYYWAGFTIVGNPW